MLVDYKKKPNGETSLKVGNVAASVIICVVLAVLVIVLIILGVSPSDVWGILKGMRWK